MHEYTSFSEHPLRADSSIVGRRQMADRDTDCVASHRFAPWPHEVACKPPFILTDLLAAAICLCYDGNVAIKARSLLDRITPSVSSSRT